MEISSNKSNILEDSANVNTQYDDSKKERDDCRIYEVELLEGGESGLEVYNSCTKNAGHKGFQTLNEFKVNPTTEDTDIQELITLTADLTVRIAVQWISTNRPQFYPNTTDPYLFYDLRGTSFTAVGTGFVCGVNRYPEGTCECGKCQNSDTPSKQWGEVSIATASHVVFDESEAKKTTCRFFYDKKDSPLVTMDGTTSGGGDKEDDRGLFTCATCDVALLDKLQGLWIKWQDQKKQLHDKYITITDEIKTVYIVSHPHGCPKMVSAGQWIDKYEKDNKTYYTYTASTCRGSSGAYVYKPGCVDFMTYHRHVHSGVNKENANFSGKGYEFVNKPLLRNGYIPGPKPINRPSSAGRNK